MTDIKMDQVFPESLELFQTPNLVPNQHQLITGESSENTTRLCRISVEHLWEHGG